MKPSAPLIAAFLALSAALPANGTENIASGNADHAERRLPPILSLRERARLEDLWLARRLDTVVPALMRENGVDMWVLIAREYVEDPVVETMLDAKSLNARRRTILLFHDPGHGPIERLTVSRYDLGGFFVPTWDPSAQPDQWARLAEIIEARDPRRIALNMSSRTALADGLTRTQSADLMAALPPHLRSRVESVDALAVGWLERRIPEEMAQYPEIARLAHAIIAEGLSRQAVTPGATTADDLGWWFRERANALGLGIWFHPDVALFRRGEERPLEGEAVILPGDMVWVDFGITYLGLNTDMQQLAYVLRPGERAPPPGLIAGLAAANRVQDALTSGFRTGITGNALLADARARATAAGLKPTIYSHPLGFHGHGAGSAIGFWDNQGDSPQGELPLRADTVWSIELSARHAVEEWDGQEIDFRLEENAYFDGETVRYLDGRQTRFHLIGE